MAKRSAGILVYRRSQPNTARNLTPDTQHPKLNRPWTQPSTLNPLHLARIDVFLIHPGGPFWAKRDVGAWSIPKGEFTGEDPLQAAKREFFEETGYVLEGEFMPLRSCTQRGGKVVLAWAVEADLDATQIKSNTFEIEWPPRSGQKQAFPEVDRAGWFTIEEAMEKINAGQAPLLADLVRLLSAH